MVEPTRRHQELHCPDDRSRWTTRHRFGALGSLRHTSRERTELKEGEGEGPSNADITNGKNSHGAMGYTGPCGPPVDAPHHYVIDVVALDLAPEALQPGLDREQLLKSIAGHSLGPASLVVRYHREP
jgi:phosphatidylethanolamine-binding protein (PEBP) family uncharacterized protein